MNIIKEAPLRSDNFWVGKGGLTIEHHGEATKQGKSFSMFLEDIKSENRQERSPYVGMAKDEVLVKKAELRKGGQLAPKTAFEECLEQAGIKVSGRWSDPVSKFFEYSDTSVLFPEFVVDRVHAGLLATSLVSEFCFQVNDIDSETYQKIYLEDDQDDRDLLNTGKTTDLPGTVIEVGDQVVKLDRYGRYVTMSKIDMKFQRANVFGRFMERVGQQIGIRQTDLMFYRLINGDGNTSTTPQGGTTTSSASGAGELSLRDAITFASQLPTPYKMDKFVGRKAALVYWYNRMYDALTTSIGSDVFNLFPKPYEWDRSTITANYFWGVDSRYAIEMITSGGVQIEAENLVRKTSQGTSIWCMYEFPIADANAVAIMDNSS